MSTLSDSPHSMSISTSDSLHIIRSNVSDSSHSMRSTAPDSSDIINSTFDSSDSMRRNTSDLPHIMRRFPNNHSINTNQNKPRIEQIDNKIKVLYTNEDQLPNNMHELLINMDILNPPPLLSWHHSQ